MKNIIKLYLGISDKFGSYYSSSFRSTASFMGCGDVTITRQTKGKQDDVWPIWLNDLEVDFETLPAEVYLNPKTREVFETRDEATASAD